MNITAHYPFEVLPLKYSPNSLEPFLDCQTITIHHDCLYNHYVEKLNSILFNYPDLHNWSLEELIFHSNYLPDEARDDIIKAASGTYNHQIYFNSISSCIKEPVNSPLIVAIINEFQSFDNFFQTFIRMALKKEGSGYLWLVSNEMGEVSLYVTNNQETTIPLNLCQIMGIDLWEHAFFYKYYLNKKDYIINFFRYLDWDYLNNEYLECLKFSSKY